MAKRNSQLTELLIVAQDDYLTIVDTSAGQSKRVSVKNLTGAPDVGWTATGEAWSFSSWNSTTKIGVITVPSDATTKYSKGMWIRISQSTGGTKIGYIMAVTATSLTVNFFNLYTLNNEAISSPVYSPLAQPYGAPALPVVYTDANGWIVRDYGWYKNWRQDYNWPSSTIAGGSRDTTKSTTYPVGVAQGEAFYFSNNSVGTYAGHTVTGFLQSAGTLNPIIAVLLNSGSLAISGTFTIWAERITW